MSAEPDRYQVYLLRLWRVRYKGKWQWRASLQSPHTEERQSFADLDGLCHYFKTSFAEDEADLDLKRVPSSSDSGVADAQDGPATPLVSD